MLGRRIAECTTGRSGVTVKAPNFQFAAFHTPHTTALSATTLLLAVAPSLDFLSRSVHGHFRECLSTGPPAVVVPRDVYYTSTDEQL